MHNMCFGFWGEQHADKHRVLNNCNLPTSGQQQTVNRLLSSLAPYLTTDSWLSPV